LARLVAVKIPDDVYKELERRAREAGYTLVSDYVRDIILRELGRAGISLRGLEERLTRLEEGDLTPRLYERILEIVKSVLAESIEKTLTSSNVIEVKGDVVDKVVQRVERKVMDIINPFTAKVDNVASKLADLIERIEILEERVKKLEEEFKRVREQAIQKHHRRTAIDRLKERGVVFESELRWLRDRDAFFERLRRDGAIILDVKGERIAVYPSFWSKFKDKVEKLPTAIDDEIKVLLRDVEYKLFSKLREAGLVYYDASKRAWKFVQELEPQNM